MKFLILGIFFVMSIFAQDTHFLFMNGGRNKNMNYRTYYNEIRYGYEVTKSKGFDSSVITSDGTWSKTVQRDGENFSTFSITEIAEQNKDEDNPVNYPPINSSLKSKDELISYFKELKLKRGESLALIINGHGDYGEKNEVGDQLVDLWGVQITWKELGEILKQHVPSSSEIKITTNICNGGGVHYLSRTMNNVCSSSSVPHFIPSSSGVYSMSLYSEGFFKDVMENENSSLASASISAFSNDYANQGLGSLSSFDYIDYVLGKGQYSHSESQNPEINFDASYDLFSKYDEAIKFLERPEGFDPTFSITPKPEIQCIECQINNIIELNAGILNSRDFAKQMKKIAKLPYTNLLLGAQQDIVENSSSYIVRLRSAVLEINKIQMQYDELKKKNEEASAVLSWWYGYEDEVKELQMKLDRKKAKYQKDLQPILNNLQLANIARKTYDFLKVATNEQKDKLSKLWECEWQKF